MARTQIRLAVIALLIQLGMATNYTVGGDSNGWDTTTNPEAWASAQTFAVGDILIFQFTPNHDVLEVSKADYDSCSTSNPTQTYSSSPVVITLSSPGMRCFICGTAGHCGQGMKIQVDALASSSSPPLAPPTSSPAPPVTPPSSSSPPPKASNGPSVESPTSSPPPSPSSAYKGSFQASLVMGFGFIMTILMAL